MPDKIIIPTKYKIAAQVEINGISVNILGLTFKETRELLKLEEDDRAGYLFDLLPSKVQGLNGEPVDIDELAAAEVAGLITQMCNPKKGAEDFPTSRGASASPAT